MSLPKTVACKKLFYTREKTIFAVNGKVRSEFNPQDGHKLLKSEIQIHAQMKQINKLQSIT